MAYESYNAYLLVAKSTPKESFEDYFNEFVDNQFENSTTIKTIIHNGISITVRVVGIFSKESPTRRVESVQKIIFKQNNYTVNIGDIFEFDNDKWLCTDVNSTPVSKSCSVTKCTSTLTFYQTGISYQIPCVIFDKQNINTEENKYLSTIDCDILVLIPNNQINNLISPDDIFKIGRWNYYVTKPDDITKPGLIVLPMKFSEEEQIEHVYTIEILNDTTVDIQESTTLQLNINVYDNNQLISPTPLLTFISSDETICTVSENGLVTALSSIGSCVITVSLVSDNSISESININVIAVPQDNYTYTLTSIIQPDDEIIITQTKTFTAQKYNNGVAVAQTFTFSVVGDSLSYQLTIVDENSCQVKALKSGVTITLQAVDDSDVSKVVSKEITLKNLF